MEFRMTTDLSVMQPKELTFNFEELYTLISEKTEKYRNLMVTEDGIAEAKKDRATLRKLADALNAEKIAQKKAFMKPYDEFEAKVKQLIDLCKVPANEIDVQIKAFEEAKKAEKKAELENFFLENIGEATDYVDFDYIFDPKWLNASVSVETAKETITEVCARFIEDIGVLNTLCEEVDTSTAYALKRSYKATKSLSSVMRVKNEIEKEIRLQQQRKEQEEARLSAEKEKMQKQENPSVYNAENLQHVESIEAKTEPVIVEDEKIEVCFRVKCTKTQLAALKVFLMNNGIQYGKV